MGLSLHQKGGAEEPFENLQSQQGNGGYNRGIIDWRTSPSC